jgi:hypothetical protein
MESLFDDKPIIEEVLGGTVARGKTLELIERIKEAHKDVKVTIICRSDSQAAICKVLATVAGLDVVDYHIEEDERLLPDGKAIIVLNPDGVDIADKAEQIKAALERVLTIHTEMPIPQQRIDEYEEILKQKDALKTYVIQEELENRKFQKEQMKQRSRYLSKHCRK